MRVVRCLGWCVKSGIAAFALMTLSMLAWTFLWPEPDMADLKQADAIVCLGGGMSPNGTLEAAVLTRIERCVQIYEAGLAPVIIFSGGTASPTGPSAGHQMGLYAQTLGLPLESVIEESRAHSTLQNALFSLELAPNAQDFIVVTEAFHLPRSWASFHWASWQMGNAAHQTFTPVMSEDVRRHQPSGDVNWRILVRESLAIWFNAGRAVAYSVVPDAPVDWLH